MKNKNATELRVAKTSEKLIPFFVGIYRKNITNFAWKEKNTPEKEWVYPELGFMSWHRGVTKHYDTKIDIFLENNALLEINDKEWIDYDIPKSLVAVDKVMIVIGKHT